MSIPSHLVGQIYDDHTRQVIRKSLARYSEAQLRHLKQQILSGTVKNITKEQAMDYVQLIDEQLANAPQSSIIPTKGQSPQMKEIAAFQAKDEIENSFQKAKAIGDAKQDTLEKYIQGNIQQYGFIARADAQEFFRDRYLGTFDSFPKKLKQALRQACKTLDCRISRVAVPSLESSQILLIYAKERNKHRKNSWELAVHQYFLNGLAKLIEDLGHHLPHRHALPNGKYNDLFVESGITAHSGHIEIKTGGTVTKQDFPQVRAPYLVITPWKKRRGKTHPVGRNKKRVPIPLGEANRIKSIVGNIGENYSVLAVSDPDFKQKLDAWINTGRLERAATDPKHSTAKG